MLTTELTRAKVIIKFLKNVQVKAETAVDGQKCTDMVFGKPHGYYSIILVSTALFRFVFPIPGSWVFFNSATLAFLSRTDTKYAAKSDNGNVTTTMPRCQW